MSARLEVRPSSDVQDGRLKSGRFYTRADLARIATDAMLERRLEPEFSAEVQPQLAQITSTGAEAGADIHDLTALLWCSIDNRRLARSRSVHGLRGVAPWLGQYPVAIADVDVLVKIGTAMDEHARTNTTSVYTAARLFPMPANGQSRACSVADARQISLSGRTIRSPGRLVAVVPAGS